MSSREPSVADVDRLPPMTHSVLGLLRRPASVPPRNPGEAEPLQERHLAHPRRLRERLASGPVEEKGELPGVLLFRTEDLPHTRELMRPDPLAAGGHLALDLYTWFAQVGLVHPTGEAGPAELTFETD